MPYLCRLLACAIYLSVPVCMLPVAAVAADETAPPGVKIEVLTQDAPLPPVHEAMHALDDSLAQEPRLDLAYEGVPFGHVLDDLEDKLGVIILCDDEWLLWRSYYRRMVVPESRALAAVCGSVLQYARPVHVVCMADEVRDGRHRPEIQSDLLVNIDLKEAELGPALDWIRRTAGLGVAASETVAGEVVSYAAEGVTVERAMDGIAQAAGLVHTTGFLLQPVDVEWLGHLENMSDEALNQLFSERLKAADGAAKEGGGLGVELQDWIGFTIQDGLRMYNELEPDRRVELIQRGARVIERFARITQRLEPDTRARLGQVARPATALAVAGYVALPPHTRAELAPIMQALQAFQW